MASNYPPYSSEIGDRFNADLGDFASDFTASQIEDLYDEARGDYDLMLALGVRRLMFKYSKRSDFEAGEFNKKESQIFKNLEALYDKLVGDDGVSPDEPTKRIGFAFWRAPKKRKVIARV